MTIDLKYLSLSGRLYDTRPPFSGVLDCRQWISVELRPMIQLQAHRGHYCNAEMKNSAGDFERIVRKHKWIYTCDKLENWLSKH